MRWKYLSVLASYVRMLYLVIIVAPAVCDEIAQSFSEYWLVREAYHITPAKIGLGFGI